MSEQRWIQAVVVAYGVTLIVYGVLQNWLFAMSFSGSCTGEENYGTPPVVFETSLIAGLLVSLLFASNLSMILMMVRQQTRSFILLAGALFTNFIISLELKIADISSAIFDFVEILRGSMNADRFWWNLPHTMTTLAGVVSVFGIFLLMVCWLVTGNSLIKTNKTPSTSKE